MTENDFEDEELQKLKEETQSSNRVQEAAKEDVYENYEADIVAALRDRSETNTNQTVSIWNKELAALVDVLEENDELFERVLEELLEELGWNHVDPRRDEVSRGELLAMFIRAGMQEVDPELYDVWRDAVGEAARGP